MTQPSDDPLLLAIKIKPVVAKLQPARATEIAHRAGLKIEQTYMGLVKLYDMGLAKVIVGDRSAAGSFNQWELR